MPFSVTYTEPGIKELEFSGPAYFSMNGDESTFIKSCLKDGKHTLELVDYTEDLEEPIIYNQHILFDNEDVKITMEKETGIYEISDGMCTSEEYFGAFQIEDNKINRYIL